MSGFVYIWRDKKYNRYYVGSHWGQQDDGYICSSRWMRKAYRRRPQDFKRRILKIIDTNRKDLLIEEERWLGMIKRHELKHHYYNLNLGGTGHWSAEHNVLSIKEKISRSSKGRIISEKTREKYRQIQKDRVALGVHNFLNGEEQRQRALIRVANGTHNLLGGEVTRQQFKNGTNAAQKSHTCPHCGKVGKGTLMFYHHFDRCKKVRSPEIEKMISDNAKRNRRCGQSVGNGVCLENRTYRKVFGS